MLSKSEYHRICQVFRERGSLLGCSSVAVFAHYATNNCFLNKKCFTSKLEEEANNVKSNWNNNLSAPFQPIFKRDHPYPLTHILSPWVPKTVNSIFHQLYNGVQLVVLSLPTDSVIYDPKMLIIIICNIQFEILFLFIIQIHLHDVECKNLSEKHWLFATSFELAPNSPPSSFLDNFSWILVTYSF